jgi:16S rRNA (uracil1498-N3)-methyltransferase
MQASTSRVPRFHVPASLAAGATLSLPPDAAHHASRVLRLQEGEPVVLFNGAGGQYAARVVRLSRDGVTVEIGAFSPVEKESPLAVTLIQGISAGDRMDLTIQKAVELGVHAIQPILAERSVVRLKGERSDSRRDHWQRVASAASEQCGRNRVPPVSPALALTAFSSPPNALKILLSPDGQATLRTVAAGPEKPVFVAAGPEAGFSPKEEALFAAAGFISVKLGPRVLRTETAGPAALAALNALHGDG